MTNTFICEIFWYFQVQPTSVFWVSVDRKKKDQRLEPGKGKCGGSGDA